MKFSLVLCSSYFYTIWSNQPLYNYTIDQGINWLNIKLTLFGRNEKSRILQSYLLPRQLCCLWDFRFYNFKYFHTFLREMKSHNSGILELTISTLVLEFAHFTHQWKVNISWSVALHLGNNTVHKQTIQGKDLTVNYLHSETCKKAIRITCAAGQRLIEFHLAWISETAGSKNLKIYMMTAKTN